MNNIEIRETCAFDPETQEEPTCACGYELDTDFPAYGVPHDKVAFCWNCRFYWGVEDE